MFTVNQTLSVFRIMSSLLAKREAKLAAKVNAIGANLNVLITQREAHQSEIFRAQAAQKKLREFNI